MTRYRLDTTILSYLVDSRAPAYGRVHERLAALADDDEVSMSILTRYELHHWLAHDQGRRAVIDAVVADFRIAPLDGEGAVVFGQLAPAWRDRHGGLALARAVVDSMIAATAIVVDHVLVSNDGVLRTLAEPNGRLRVENRAAMPGSEGASAASSRM